MHEVVPTGLIIITKVGTSNNYHKNDCSNDGGIFSDHVIF